MNQIDVISERHKIVRHLSSHGYKPDSASGTNFIHPHRSLQFKIGTSYGEVTVHIREGRETVDTVRILNASQVGHLLNRIDDLVIMEIGLT